MRGVEYGRSRITSALGADRDDRTAGRLDAASGARVSASELRRILESIVPARRHRPCRRARRAIGVSGSSQEIAGMMEPSPGRSEHFPDIP